MTYFDNATTSFPKPPHVCEDMLARYQDLGVSPSRGAYALAREMGGVVQNLREALARLFNASSPASIVLTPSATFSLNQILLGLPPERTRCVYVSPFEHNSVLRPLHKLRKSRPVDLRFLPFNQFEWDEPATRRLFDQSPPGLVAAMHASNVFGNILPVESIFKLAREYGAVTVMDCAQTAGVLPVDVQAMSADFTAFPGHKGFCGPSGIGGFVVNRDLPLDPIITGGTGVHSEDMEPPESIPDRYESGSLNALGILGLDLALAWLEETGLSALRGTKRDVTQQLAKILSRHPGKVTLHSDLSRDNIGVLSCTFAPRTPAEMGVLLDRSNIAVRAGLHCAPFAHRHLNTFPLGTVRFSPGPFTTPQDLATLDAFMRTL